MSSPPHPPSSPEQLDWLVRGLTGGGVSDPPGTLGEALSSALHEGVTTLLVSKWKHSARNHPINAAFQERAILLAARAMSLARERERIVEHIAPVNPIVLKGEALARHLYDDYSLRPMSDMDILVRQPDLEHTISLLEQQGYLAAATNSGSLVMPQYTLTRTLSNDLASVVDLHLLLFNRPALQGVLGYDELRRHANPSVIRGGWIPCLEHLLLHAALHLSAHHANEVSLIWLYDIYLLRLSLDARRVSRLLDVVERQQLWEPVASAVSVSEQYFPVPGDPLWQQLESCTSKHTNQSEKLWISDKSPVEQARDDWNALDSVGRKSQWLRQHLFPKQDYMRQRYGVVSSWSLPLFYLWRIVKGTVKLVSSR